MEESVFKDAIKETFDGTVLWEKNLDLNLRYQVDLYGHFVSVLCVGIRQFGSISMAIDDSSRRWLTLKSLTSLDG